MATDIGPLTDSFAGISFAGLFGIARFFSSSLTGAGSAPVDAGGFLAQLPLHGAIDQKKPAYQRKLKARGIVLPAIAFHPNTPTFVVDLLDRSDHELHLYGFIQ